MAGGHGNRNTIRLPRDTSRQHLVHYGGMFFRTFPWVFSNNFDFISEKWRTCRRTRNLAYIHVASSTVAILYLTLYAEVHRRVGNNKELGAALAAILFNVFLLMKTGIGILRLNAFVAWCKDTMECMHALSDRYVEEDQRHADLRADTGSEGVDSGQEDSEQDSEQESSGETRGLNRFAIFTIIHDWCKRAVQRMASFGRRKKENNEKTSSAEDAGSEILVDAHLYFANDEEEDIEERIRVNCKIVDKDLSGREITVLPSFEKTWNGLKNRRFTPSMWLLTDQVMLNTVLWSGAYLCEMGRHWGADRLLFE